MSILAPTLAATVLQIRTREAEGKSLFPKCLEYTDVHLAVQKISMSNKGPECCNEDLWSSLTFLLFFSSLCMSSIA